jgi:hypothetical protein
MTGRRWAYGKTQVQKEKTCITLHLLLGGWTYVHITSYLWCWHWRKLFISQLHPASLKWVVRCMKIMIDLGHRSCETLHLLPSWHIYTVDVLSWGGPGTAQSLQLLPTVRLLDLGTAVGTVVALEDLSWWVLSMSEDMGSCHKSKTKLKRCYQEPWKYFNCVNDENVCILCKIHDGLIICSIWSLIFNFAQLCYVNRKEYLKILLGENPFTKHYILSPPSPTM